MVAVYLLGGLFIWVGINNGPEDQGPGNQRPVGTHW